MNRKGKERGRKILRRIFRPKYKNGERRIRSDRELYDLFNNPHIINMSKISKRRKLGHMKLREEGTLLNNICRGNIGGRRVGEHQWRHGRKMWRGFEKYRDHSFEEVSPGQNWMGNDNETGPRWAVNSMMIMNFTRMVHNIYIFTYIHRKFYFNLILDRILLLYF